MTKISIEYGDQRGKRKKSFENWFPFGQVWRAGANEATKITLVKKCFGGQKVKKTNLRIVCSSQERMENHFK